MIFYFNDNIIQKTEAHYARFNSTTTWHQLNPESHTQLAELLSNPNVFGCSVGNTKNPEILSSRVYKIDEATHHQFSTNKITEKSNVVCFDIEVSSTLEQWVEPPLSSLNKVIDFIESLGMTSYIIGRSSSAIEKDHSNKWHVYCMFDYNVNLNVVKNMLTHKLPQDQWYYGLTSAGTELIKHSYLDLSTFQLSRYFYEHPLVDFYIVDNGLNHYSSTIKPYFKEKTVPEFIVNRPFSLEEQDLRVSQNIRNSSSTGTKTQFSRFLHLDDVLLDKRGKAITVRDLYDANVNTRVASFIDNDGMGMAYYADTKTFIDWHDGAKRYSVSLSKNQVIKYNTKYLPKLDLSNTNTFILAPTGSGKTTAIKNNFKNKVIFIVPTRAIVKDQDGMMSGLFKWDDLKHDEVNFMTYDKLVGHLKTGADISDYNLVIDEVHTLFNSHSDPIRQFIFNKILTREIEFKKLVLLTATFHTELLPVDSLVSYKYINTSNKTHIQFVKNVHSIRSMISGRTLIFYQSKKVLDEIFTTFSPEFNVLTLESGQEIPKDLSEYDIIATTSVLREGFSITSHIDTVLLYNIHNAFGAYDIIQSIARPRVSLPAIKIISASTHFEDTVHKWPSLADLRVAADELSKGYTVSDVNVLQAISIEQFKRFTLMTDELLNYPKVNELGVVCYYLHIQKQCEVKDFKLMSERIKEFLYCDIELYIDTNDRNELPQFSLKELEQRLRQTRTFKELEAITLELEHLKEYQRQASRLLKNLNDTIEFIDTKDGLMYLNEEQRVQYKVNPAAFSKINQHKKNIDAGVYDLLESKRSWKYKDTFDLRGLKIILKALDKHKTYTDDEVVEQLRKICVFEKLNGGHVVRRGKFDHIRIVNKRLFDLSKSPEIKTIEVEGI